LLTVGLVLGGFLASLRFQSLTPARPLSFGEIAGFVAVGVFSVLLLRFVGKGILGGACRVFARLPGGLWVPLLAGVMLRILSAWLIAPEPTSDGATYLGLAMRLAESQPYQTGSLFSYWPPGLPLLLAPLIAVLGPGLLALTVYGLLCFVAAAWGAWRLSARLGLAAWSAVPVWLLALWPTHVLCSGLPEKELLVIALLPWIPTLLLDAWVGRRYGAALAGLLFGAMLLVQPSLQLLLPAGVVLALLLCQQRLRVLGLSLLVLVGMLVVVLPWTYRNYQLLGEPVFISTNGGSNFYRANNELATGAYVEHGKIQLHSLSELESNRVGKVLAFEWMREHPLDVLQLSLGKALLFSGDDSYGAYAALKRGRADVPVPIYRITKLVAALPWLLLWALIGAAALQRGVASAPLLLVPLLPYLYLLGIHSFFESGGKYHLSALVPVLVLAVLLVKRTALPPSDRR